MMTVDDINESLVGKRIEGNFGGEFRQGTVIDLLDKEYTYGFVVKVDKPVFMMSGDFNADTWYQDTFEVEVRKYDNFDWGALKSKTIISDSVKQNKTTNMRRIKDEQEVVDRYYVYEGDSIAGEDFEYEDDAINFAEELVERGAEDEVIVERRTYTTYDDGSMDDADIEVIWSSHEDYISDGYNRLNVSDSYKQSKNNNMKRINDRLDEPVLITETDNDALYVRDVEFEYDEDGIVHGYVLLTLEDYSNITEDEDGYYGETDSDNWEQGFSFDAESVRSLLDRKEYRGDIPYEFVDKINRAFRYDGEPYFSKEAKNKLNKFIAETYLNENYDFYYDKKFSDSRKPTRSLTRRIKDSVKMKNVRKRITDAKEKFFNNDLKRMQAYRRVTDSTGKIKENVVFLIEDSDVLAVFPNTYGTANRDRDTMVCYSHDGQHGVCTYDYANTLKTADSYDALKDELTNYVGYNLTIVDSLPSETELKQNAREIRDSYKQHKRHAITDERMLARGEEIEYKGKRGTVQYALFHGQEPVVIRWQNEEGSEEFEVPYNEVGKLKIHDSDDDSDNDIDTNVEPVENDSDIDDAEVTDNCGGKKKTKKKTADNVKRVKITKRQSKKTE